MCNCGRTNTEVITSAQASEDQLARAAQDAAAQAEIQTASAQNALANASTGWFAEPDPA